MKSIKHTKSRNDANSTVIVSNLPIAICKRLRKHGTRALVDCLLYCHHGMSGYDHALLCDIRNLLCINFSFDSFQVVQYLDSLSFIFDHFLVGLN